MAQKHQQRKITLAQVTFSTDVGTLLTIIINGFLSAISSSDLLFAIIGGTSAGISTLLTIGDRFLSSTSSGSCAIAVSGGGFLTFIASDISSVFAVSNSNLLFLSTGSIGSAFAICCDSLLFSIASDISFAFAIFGDSFFSPIVDNSPLFLTAGSVSLSTGLPVLSLSSILFYTRRLFWPL